MRRPTSSATLSDSRGFWRFGALGLAAGLWVMLSVVPAHGGGPCYGGGYGGHGGYGYGGPAYNSGGYFHFGGPSGGTYAGYGGTQYGSYYSTYRPFNSVPDFDQYQWKQERRQHEQEMEAKRQLADDRRDAREAARERYAYTPPRAEGYSIVLTGYESNDYAQVVDASLAENRAKARQTVAPKAPPAVDGYVLVGVRDNYYYYSDGEFSVPRGGGMKRVSAPAGAVVFELPETAEPKIVNRKVYYTCKDAWYIQTEFLDQTVYKVVEPPTAREPEPSETSPDG